MENVSKEYFWWNLEESYFIGVLHDSIGLYFLEDHPYTNWEEFLSNDPHMAYAQLTYVRFDSLEQQFVDLRVIPQMLGVEKVPVISSVKNINRYDWLKSIVDLALFRFSSIRDILFHFINEVLKLNIENYKLNTKYLIKALKHKCPEIIEDIKLIDKAGSSLRDNRNERAHKGFSNLFTKDDQMFRSVSWIEEQAKIHDYDLVAVYESSREIIYKTVVSEVKNALEITIKIVDELYPYYRDEFENLANNSKTGDKLSQHFHLHKKED